MNLKEIAGKIMASMFISNKDIKILKENEEAHAKMINTALEKDRPYLVYHIEALLELAKERYSSTVFPYPGDAVIYNKVAWYLEGGHSVKDALHNTDTAVITDLLRKDINRRTGK